VFRNPETLCIVSSPQSHSVLVICFTDWPQALLALSKQLKQETHRALAACAASALGSVIALSADGRGRASSAEGAHELTAEEDVAMSALVCALEHGYDGVRVAAACAVGKAGLRNNNATSALLKIVEVVSLECDAARLDACSQDPLCLAQLCRSRVTRVAVLGAWSGEV
jgi:hypothetical protein